MSGSNKYSNIKHRKGARDAARSRRFSRMSREIALAVRDGGDNPDDNAALRLLLRKARSENMPSASIQRARSRARNGDAASLRTLVFEGMARGGVGLVVEALTDNHKRTTSFVRSTLSKHGAELLKSGSVAHRFAVVGRFDVPSPADVDALVLSLMDEGLEDFVVEGELLRLHTSRAGFGPVRQALIEEGLTPQLARLVRRAHEPRLVDAAAWASLERLVEALTSDDDVRHVVIEALPPRCGGTC